MPRLRFALVMRLLRAARNADDCSLSRGKQAGMFQDRGPIESCFPLGCPFKTHPVSTPQHLLQATADKLGSLPTLTNPEGTNCAGVGLPACLQPVRGVKPGELQYSVLPMLYSRLCIRISCARCGARINLVAQAEL